MDELPRHRSTLASHPDVGAVLPFFVARLPGHVARLGELQAAGDRAGIARLAHQLRGAGKTFGFGGLSDCAAALEDLILAGAAAADVDAGVRELIAYMERIEGYGGGEVSE